MTQYHISWDPVQGSMGYLVEYRKWNTLSWVTPIVPANPTLYTTYELTVDGVSGYDVRISSRGSSCMPSYKYVVLPPTEVATTTTTSTSSTSTTTTSTSSSTTTTTTTVAVYYVWAQDAVTCEQEEVFVQVNEYTGFSSPYIAHYDATTDRVYIGDNDAALNAYYFTPGGFSGSVTTIAGLSDIIYQILVDEQYRRMYFIGKNTGGLKSLSFATNTFTSVAYGTDGTNFNRVDLSILGNKIYAFDTTGNSIVIIDRATLTVDSTVAISSIPSGTTYLTSSFDLHLVGGNIWVTSLFKTAGNITIYDPTFTTLVGTITLPSITTETSGRYRQVAYLDSTNNVFYVSDAGSGKLYMINTSTQAIISTYTFNNREGKDYVLVNRVIDPVNGQWYLTYQGYNTPGENDAVYRTYKWDRVNRRFTDVYKDQTFNNLTLQKGTSNLWGTATGVRVWDVPNTGYGTDGKILKYSK